MERELQTISTKREIISAAMGKLDGKDIVELVEVAMGTALFGLMMVCLTGSEINIGNWKCVVSGKKNYASIC